MFGVLFFTLEAELDVRPNVSNILNVSNVLNVLNVSVLQTFTT